MAMTPDSHAGGPGFKSRCRPTKVWSPNTPIPRLQVAKMRQGSRKGWCTQKPSTRDDKKIIYQGVYFPPSVDSPLSPVTQGGTGDVKRAARKVALN